MKKITNKLKHLVDPKRYLHCLAVEKTAIKLAKAHNVDPNKTSKAALLHDCARSVPHKDIIALAKRSGLKIDPFVKKQPRLLHGHLSAHFAQSKFGITDKDILRAIAFHTSGRPAMTKLEKVIFVADHTEPSRRYRNIGTIRRAAARDLDKAIALITKEVLQYLLDKDIPIFCQTVKTRNYYLNCNGR